MIQTYPLRFRPLIKQTLWGGRQLGERLGKPIGDESNYAESWEIVDHQADQSVVESGPLAGKTLHQLLQSDPQWLLGGSVSGKEFPLLLKYLDCNRVLSVQVHPSDDYAARMPVPDLGKTEAWYVVDAQPQAVIYAGLKPGVDAPELRRAIEDGSAEAVLHSFHPEKGDFLFIPDGTVHALGAGLLIAEIQQSSDTTFRLYDWNRSDGQGNPRPLHIEAGLAVTDFDRGPVDPIRIRRGSSSWQTVVDCEYFRLRAAVESADRGLEIGGDGHFHILTVPHGAASLLTDSCTYPLRTGDSVLLPAAHPKARIVMQSESTVLEISR